MSEVHGAKEVRSAKILLIVSSLICLIFLGLSAYQDNLGGEWRRHQTQYKEKLPPELGAGYKVGLKQNYLPELNKVDRCVSCHVAVEDPKNVNQSQPLRTHSGDILANHPIDKFGCTVCHGGQGRMVTKEDAHGNVPHWEEPLLRGKDVYTSCGKCHADNDLFGGEAAFYNRPTDEMEIFDEELKASLPEDGRVALGKQLVQKGGCLGCHTYRGKGGMLGPDITYVGDKTIHSYDYSHLGKDEDHTPRNWLLRHFENPEEVSPGTVMPDMGLSKEDAVALTDYMLSLKRRTISAAYVPPPKPAGKTELSGKELYGLFCAACHGEEGKGSDVPAIMTPTLNNQDVLSIAGNHYYRYMIAHGRSDSTMPRWDEKGGNLTPKQIERVVNYIRSWEAKGATAEAVEGATGDPKIGRALYHGNCGGCHGPRGAGGKSLGGAIGPSLDSPGFLSMASDEFLAETIIHGRPDTAMPSWKTFSGEDVADVVAYIRSFTKPKKPYSWDDVKSVLPEKGKKPNSRSVRIGKKVFKANCSGCHGKKGEGNLIGPALANHDFLSQVENKHIYMAIVEGRPGTAMPAWKHMEKEDVVDLINYLRSLDKKAPKNIKIAKEASLHAMKTGGAGDAQYGEILYKQGCLGCHGENGEGGNGPQLNNPVFLKSASDEFLFRSIAEGRSDTAMRGFLKGKGSIKGVNGDGRTAGAAGGLVELSGQQINSIIAYLRSFETQLRTGSDSKTLYERNHAMFGNALVGKDIYNNLGGCAKCHGVDGEGTSGPSLSNPAFLSSASDGFLAGTIILGRSGSEMLPFYRGGNVSLTDRQVLDLVAYIRQWETNPPPAGTFRKLPMTPQDVIAGKEHYGRYCASCHGPEGKGSAGEGYAPALNNPEFLKAATDGFLQATIAKGRSHTPMRPFGKGFGGIADLSAREIIQITNYIRSWQTPIELPDQNPNASKAEGTTPDHGHGHNNQNQDSEPKKKDPNQPPAARLEKSPKLRTATYQSE